MWKKISINPVVSSSGQGRVELKFPCPNCSNEIVTPPFSVPAPNDSAENHSDSDVYFEEYEVCDKCEEEIQLNCSNGHGGFYVNIDGVEENDIFFR